MIYLIPILNVTFDMINVCQIECTPVSTIIMSVFQNK